MTTPPPARRPASWPVLLLALPAFVAIWSGWVGLGSLTGFGVVRPLPGIWDAARLNTAITLPIGVETYAAYALRIWLSGSAGQRAARFARASALGSLGLGATGQVAYHLMSAAHMNRAPWPITALVACLPVAVLGMGAALAHLSADHAEQADDVADVEDQAAETDTAPPTADDDVAEVPGEVPAADPTPAPRPAPRSTTTRTARPSARAGAATAARVARLRERHPDWTLTQIAKQAGVSPRTVSRHLNTLTPDSTDSAPAPAEQAA